MREEKNQIETVVGGESPSLPESLSKECVRCHKGVALPKYSYCLECRRDVLRISYHKNKEKNREKHNARRREYYSKNSEKERTAWKEYAKSDRGKKIMRDWAKRNREHLNAKSRVFYYKNLETRRAKSLHRYRVARNLIGQVCMICQESRCVEWCHIIPRAKGGVNHEWNILYLCPTHHRIFDNARPTFTAEEWERIDARVREAESHR